MGQGPGADPRPPSGHRRYLEEPAYLGRDFPAEDGYPARRRFQWAGPLVMVPLAATILEFASGNTVVGLVFLLIFAACSATAYLAVRRQIRSELEPRHPRRYP